MSENTAIETQGVKYAGSKLKILPHILKLIRPLPVNRVFDGFSGTTRVAQALAQQGYEVIANDIAVWPYWFGQCYLMNTRPAAYYEPLIRRLNTLPGKSGWFTQHYGGEDRNGAAVQPDGTKRPWLKHNTRKLDAIRKEIDALWLPKAEKGVLLTSLILALDRVDSTLGHQASYLREWAPRARKTMLLEVPRLIPRTARHRVFRKDIFDLAGGVEADLAYYDPPYGSNNEKMPPSRVRYASYYHLWTTVCLNDRPRLFGKAHRRADTGDLVAGSVFESYQRGRSGRFVAVEALERLIRQTRSRFILLSYSSGGRATAEELMAVLDSRGSIAKVVQVDYQRNVMAAMRWTHDWVRDSDAPHREFLFLLEQ